MLEWLIDNRWAQYVLISIIIVFFLTLIAFVLAAFESEHYLNSPFRGGKKITFKRALRNYIFGLYMVLAVLGASYYGVVQVFEQLELLPKILIIAGIPTLSLVSAYINSKNEKYMFLKIKEFIEGFLTILCILMLVLGGIGYYVTYMN
jgi:hypothetical protein